MRAEVETIQPTGFSVAATRQPNAAWAETKPSVLSIVVPFYNFDVSALALRLIQLCVLADASVPMIFVDDGSPDRRHIEKLSLAVAESTHPVMVVALHANAGRSKVRNILCALATTEYLLYLDADMWPDEDDFIGSYLSWISSGTVDVLYGGRSARHATLQDQPYRLHRQMTAVRESLPATVRRTSPAFHFYSCNFVVRRDILFTYPLDEKFTGWGWEDMEWAARVAQRFTIQHEDNPASHLGLLTASQILKKYDESVVNFTLVLQRCPSVVLPSALFKVSKLIGLLRVGAIVRRLARMISLAEHAPFSWRIRGLMFYKAALYAPVAKAFRG